MIKEVIKKEDLEEVVIKRKVVKEIKKEVQ